MTINAILFDIGGVLVRTEDHTPRAQLAARLGTTYEALANLVFYSEQGLRAQRGEVSAEELWETVRQVLHLSPTEIPEVKRLFFAGDRLDTELLDYIRSLHTRYKTGIISNATDDTRQVIEGRWNMADAFDCIILSAEVGLMKPDPRIYQLAIDRLGVAPAEALFVDDMPVNVEGARSVGLNAIHYRGNGPLFNDLQPLLEGFEPHKERT
jgi:epoxide hydrolase-like predicted phosphatase